MLRVWRSLCQCLRSAPRSLNPAIERIENALDHRNESGVTNVRSQVLLLFGPRVTGGEDRSDGVRLAGLMMHQRGSDRQADGGWFQGRTLKYWEADGEWGPGSKDGSNGWPPSACPQALCPFMPAGSEPQAKTSSFCQSKGWTVRACHPKFAGLEFDQRPSCSSRPTA